MSTTCENANNAIITWAMPIFSNVPFFVWMRPSSAIFKVSFFIVLVPRWLQKWGQVAPSPLLLVGFSLACKLIFWPPQSLPIANDFITISPQLLNALMNGLFSHSRFTSKTFDIQAMFAGCHCPKQFVKLGTLPPRFTIRAAFAPLPRDWLQWFPVHASLKSKL